jgi:hypothetical protein
VLLTPSSLASKYILVMATVKILRLLCFLRIIRRLVFRGGLVMR